MVAVRLENLEFTYAGASEPTLSNLDLTISDGSAHALLGASGTGKTTILNLLSGLLHPGHGTIWFGDDDVSQLGARARNVALVFQFPVLYESKTILENLEFPLINRGWRRPAARDRALAVAAELELESAINKNPAQLSLFQKQLAAIAKSLVRDDVDLVLLDEPLTAVEPAMKWRLRQLLKRYQAEHNMTMVYVTHDQTEALTFADTVSVMADGKILQTGTPDDVYYAPTDTRVAAFVGSPGMQLLPCEISHGQVQLAGFTSDQPLTGDGQKILGIRSTWCNLQPHADSPWIVGDVRLLGTRGGLVRKLVTVNHGSLQLQAESVADVQRGDRVLINASRVVLFDEATP